MNGAYGMPSTLNHGPGPEPSSMERMELPTTPLSQPQSDFVVSFNTSHSNMRASEPDNDDCAQPEQRPRLDDLPRDNSTIISHRSGTDTLDTEKTIQRGSRSKKPSTDDQPTAQPAHVSHSESPPNNSERHGSNQLEEGPCQIEDHSIQPAPLSFPSPPSVDDEEVRKSKISPQLQETILSSVSTTEEGTREKQNDSTTKPSSTRPKRLYVALAALLVIVIVIVVVLNVTKEEENDGAQVANDSSGNNSISTQGPSTPLAEEALSETPTMSPSEIDSLLDDEDIVLLSSNGNQTDWNDDDSVEEASALVFIGENATAPPPLRGTTP